MALSSRHEGIPSSSGLLEQSVLAYTGQAHGRHLCAQPPASPLPATLAAMCGSPCVLQAVESPHANITDADHDVGGVSKGGHKHHRGWHLNWR